MNINHPKLENLANVVYGVCASIYATPARGRLVVLYGPNGCGKTHVARQIHRWFQRVRTQIRFLTPGVDPDEPETLANSRFENWAEIVDGMKQDQWIIFDYLMIECLVILDDVGAEHDPSGIGREKLYTILNRRENMHTIITTNLAPADWPKKLENRIASRFFRNAIHVDLTGLPDYCA